MGQIIAYLTAGLLALGILLGAGAGCQYQDRKAMEGCIERTQKPLECRAVFTSYM